MRWGALAVSCFLTWSSVSAAAEILAKLPDGRKASFTCLGNGSPAAIVEPGWGVLHPSWNLIQPALAAKTRVCVFDRPGYGNSDPGPLPRDTMAAVTDLHDALKAAGLAPPYILVGHSLGGFDARLFTYRFTQEVAGLLLLDPPTENIYRRDRQPDEDLDDMRRCIAIAKQRVVVTRDHCAPSPGHGWTAWDAAVMSRLSFFETELSEDESMVGSSADELAAARHSLGNLPLILLQANASPQDERSRELDVQAQDSSRGVHRIITNSRHYIYRDQPDVVISAFGEILDTARSRAP